MRFLDVSLEEEKTVDECQVSPSGTSLRRRAVWARNNASGLTFTGLFVCVNTVVFLTRAYQYSHTNLLEMGARACGQCLNLDCALLLLLILRRTVTRLRSSFFGHFLPCDQHVHFHKMAGWTVFLLSILHTVFHIANFVTLSEVTGISLWSYMWDTRLGIGWVWGLANPTGVVLMVILTVIVAFSHRIVRKSGYFEIFYWTHLLSLPFWVMLVLHGPNFWKWLLIPGSAFIMETCLRVWQVCTSRGKTTITAGHTLPSQVVTLVIRRPRDFDFHPGEYVYLNIPSIARFEWHPFTISSAPELEDVFTVHIRAVGEWTKRVYDLFKHQEAEAETQPQQQQQQQQHQQQQSINKGKYHQQKFQQDQQVFSLEYIPEEEHESHSNKKAAIFNLGYTPDDDELEQITDTVIQVESDGCSTGSRYVNNLLEFNRKMSVYSRPAALLPVEVQRKPSVSPAKLEANNTVLGPYPLERKKSSSLSNLAALKTELERGQGESGNSSLSGSTSSLHSYTDPFSSQNYMLGQTGSTFGQNISAFGQTAGTYEQNNSTYDQNNSTYEQNKSTLSHSNTFTTRPQQSAHHHDPAHTLTTSHTSPQLGKEGAPGWGLHETVHVHPLVNKKIEVQVDGPYGTPSTRIFSVSHAVLVGAGIGVTPFAAILQSVMMRYRAAKAPCPYCQVPSCLALPTTLRKLRKVDFVWVNRDLGSFEWFLGLLASLEAEQRVSGAAMCSFLNLHLYKTGLAPLSPALPLASSIKTGRPDWDKVFSGIRESRAGKVCVFYCGPPSLVAPLREKCIKYKFEFKREMF
ncbi:hypothetical protein Pcinc_042160 [Petrolisthes cinctipes]|uniref:FAD-binding FR-type domain-containing protein n=1 Tax=Petrolisthes cinctipes TaxID=88211 RepID=A0AAE1EH71_PETCI|nr:hypothetical protein Pcinc_042160 [Petrolisthes cinctipes]